LKRFVLDPGLVALGAARLDLGALAGGGGVPADPSEASVTRQFARRILISGLPGETVFSCDGRFLRNGRILFDEGPTKGAVLAAGLEDGAELGTWGRVASPLFACVARQVFLLEGVITVGPLNARVGVWRGGRLSPLIVLVAVKLPGHFLPGIGVPGGFLGGACGRL